MTLDIKIAAFDEETKEFTVSYWHKKSGDMVMKNEIIAEVETLYEEFAIPADETGVLEIVAEEGTEVKVGDILCRIEY